MTTIRTKLFGRRRRPALARLFDMSIFDLDDLGLSGAIPATKPRRTR